MSFDLAQTDELLSTTRAVRKRLDLERPVDLDVLLECIDLAQQAPTGGNRQGWRFVVVTDPAQRQLIADTYRRVSQSYFASRAPRRPTTRPGGCAPVRTTCATTWNGCRRW